ncbi:MAG: hypothetical protein K0U52_07605 [Gammaproteobacteria bacterium]|nr:hypothetical protein [Gammaproteobacteria bacterium]
MAKSKDTLEDVHVFLNTRQLPQLPVDEHGQPRIKQCEIVCSSAKHDMGRPSKTTTYRLFSQTITLDPKTFDKWPRSTDKCCWHCTETFDTTPLSIPKAQLPNEDTMLYMLYGIFCSASCACKWIMDKHTHDAHQILLRFKELLVNVFGCDAVDVFNLQLAGHPQTSLIKFGGSKTIEQFRRDALTVDVELLEPPFITYDMVLRERRRDHLTQQSTNSTQENQQSQQQDNQEKLLDSLESTNHPIRGLRRPTQEAQEAQEPPNETGVCNGLVEGGLFQDYVQQQQGKVQVTEPAMSAAPTKKKKRGRKSSGSLSRFLKQND